MSNYYSFVVKVPVKDIHGDWSKIDVKEFIKRELQSCGGRFMPEDPEQSLLDNVEVTIKRNVNKGISKC